jgi:alkylhydroperoxidase/carboxymuconolactone decarboxylase family protein YurZ
MGVITVQIAVEGLEELEPGTAQRLAEQNGTTPERVDELADRYREVYRSWDERLRPTITAAPEFVAAVLDQAAIPRLSPDVLSPKEVALISLAVNALVTNRDREAVRQDLIAAKEAGATPAEVLDVCMQVAGIGVHAITIGVPILAELIAEQES